MLHIWLLMFVSSPVHVHLVCQPLCLCLIQLFKKPQCLQPMQPQFWLEVLCWHILAFRPALRCLGIPDSDGVFNFIPNCSMCCIKTMWLKALWLALEWYTAPYVCPSTNSAFCVFFLLCDIVCYAVERWNPLVGKLFFVSFYWFVIKKRLKTTSNCLVLYKSALVTTYIA